MFGQTWLALTSISPRFFNWHDQWTWNSDLNTRETQVYPPTIANPYYLNPSKRNVEVDIGSLGDQPFPNGRKSHRPFLCCRTCRQLALLARSLWDNSSVGTWKTFQPIQMGTLSFFFWQILPSSAVLSAKETRYWTSNYLIHLLKVNEIDYHSFTKLSFKSLGLGVVCLEIWTHLISALTALIFWP